MLILGTFKNFYGKKKHRMVIEILFQTVAARNGNKFAEKRSFIINVILHTQFICKSIINLDCAIHSRDSFLYNVSPRVWVCPMINPLCKYCASSQYSLPYLVGLRV